MGRPQIGANGLPGNRVEPIRAGIIQTVVSIGTSALLPVPTLIENHCPRPIDRAPQPWRRAHWVKTHAIQALSRSTDPGNWNGIAKRYSTFGPGPRRFHFRRRSLWRGPESNWQYRTSRKERPA